MSELPHKNWFNQIAPTFRSFLDAHQQSMRISIGISLGAISGALSRYYLATGLSWGLGTAFPYGTLLVNLSGAFFMGLFVTLTVEKILLSPEIRLAITTGFLGSYTTFSSYELDAEKLFVSRLWEITSLYWIGSAILGVLCIELGTYLARRLP